MVNGFRQDLPLLIKDGHVIDPNQGLNETTNLLISDGIISWSGTGTPPVEKGLNVISARGMIVCPGFIDLHCHLREPGFEDKETIATGTAAAAKGGFTTVCCMPNTEPPIDQTSLVTWILTRAKKEGKAHVFPIACISRKRKGESLADMQALSLSGAVAFSDDGSPVMDTRLMHAALEKSRELNVAIMDHCEYLPLTKDSVINEGKIACKLEVKGIPDEAEEKMVARDIDLAELTGGKIHICHVSTSHSVELIRDAKKRGIKITAEVTPHHLALTEDTVLQQGTYAKVNPPLRTEKDVEALIRGINDGTINAIATDHAPHTIADKCGDLPSAAFGISGLETALGVLLGLVHSGKINISTLITKLTVEPAAIIGKHKEGSGSLKLGTAADITIIDTQKEWVVDTAEFVSKGKNTPWNGCLLKGKVMVTLVDGRIVYCEPNVNIHTKA